MKTDRHIETAAYGLSILQRRPSGLSNPGDIPLDFLRKPSIGSVTESRGDRTAFALTEQSAGLWVVGAAKCRSDQETIHG